MLDEVVGIAPINQNDHWMTRKMSHKSEGLRGNMVCQGIKGNLGQVQVQVIGQVRWWVIWWVRYWYMRGGRV